MKKLFILQLFLLAFTISPLFAESTKIVVDFGDNDENSIYRPFPTSDVLRFNGFEQLPGGGNHSENQGFRFTYFGILLKDNADEINSTFLPSYHQNMTKGYYWGNAPDSNYIGYNDSGRTVSIERIDGSPFTFEGGYFTPGNYNDGWVNLIGWAWDDTYNLYEKYKGGIDLVPPLL